MTEIPEEMLLAFVFFFSFQNFLVEFFACLGLVVEVICDLVWISADVVMNYMSLE